MTLSSTTSSTATPRSPIKATYAPQCVVLDLASILPLKILRSSARNRGKYRQIVASIREVGIVEPLVVTPAEGGGGKYLLLDGHLRVEALKDLGEVSAKCLVALDDDTYTYNKRINRLSSIQDHKMIVRDMERGVSAERLASTLNLTPKTILHRFRLLNGICDEVIELLADTPAPAKVFDILRQMKPLRQIEAAELMIGNRNFSVMFANAMLAATPQKQMSDVALEKEKKGKSSLSIAKMERELAALQMQSNAVRDSYGPDVLQLSIIQRYVATLLGNPYIVRWLAQHHMEYLKELQEIVELGELGPESEPINCDLGRV